MNRRPFFAGLIATCDRPHLLAQRALPSIAAQSRPPDALIVVDDSLPRNRRRNEQAVRAFESHSGVPVIYVPNRREKGAGGAWNTGAMEALARWRPDRVHLAFLDDDDEWKPHHLATAEAAIRRNNADFVTAAFERRESACRFILPPPPILDARAFLVGNPGVAGSFFIVKLSAFLRAGMFDEGLFACSDRDLCIRLALLPDLVYSPLAQCTAVHHADDTRPRLSNYGGKARLDGLSRFAEKYREWMTESEFVDFRKRARKLFGWRESNQKSPPKIRRKKSAANQRIAENEKIALVVGVIADTQNGADGLFGDLLELSRDARLSSLDVVVMPSSGSGRGRLEKELSRWRKAGLRAYRIDAGKLRGTLRTAFSSIDGLRSIAVNRSILQRCAARIAWHYYNPVCWILDGDCRLYALAADGRGFCRFTPDYAGEIIRLRKTGFAAAVGEVTGAAPLPRAMTVRTQLVDLLHFLSRMAKPGGSLRLGENKSADPSGDYFHDCEGQRFLESPAGFNPLSPDSDADDFLRALPELIRRILSGDAVTRPLLSCGDMKEIHRGPNTLIFDMNALRQCPNGFAFGKPAQIRRQDEVWKILNAVIFNRQTCVGNFPVIQIRDGESPQAPDIKRLVEDVAGRAFIAALANATDRHRFTNPQILIDYLTQNGADFFQKARQNAQLRMEELEASFFRIRGLAESMRGILADANGGMETTPHNVREAAGAALDDVVHRFSPTTFRTLQRRVKKRLDEILSPDALTAFPEFCRTYVAFGESDKTEWRRWLSGEHEKNANAILTRLYPHRHFRLLGTGAEGTVFADGKLARKILRSWDSRSIPDRTFLPSLAEKWGADENLYPVLGWRRDGGDAVLTLPFEKTAPYRGGLGAGITAMLAAMMKLGVLHWNLTPRNLRRRGQEVRVIDYGRDVHSFVERNFDLTVRRAWLCWRWHFRPDLKALMTASLTRCDLPELRGYEKMREAARLFGARSRPKDSAITEILRGRPKSMLDFGCGKGKNAIAFAERGIRVAACDPAMPQAISEKLSAAGIHAATTPKDFYGESFDAILLRHVVCEIRSEVALRKCLADLRRLVSPTGRVVITMCGLDGLVRDTTCAEHLFSRGADLEKRFFYRKRIRQTGAIRPHVHRPENRLLREFSRAGFAVASRREFPDIDLSRFESCGGVLQFTLKPISPFPQTTLIIRACAMESETLEFQVRHLIRQLNFPRGFAEIMLAVDGKETGFLRRHHKGDLPSLMRAAKRLKMEGWIDRIVIPPTATSALRMLNRKWLGLDCAATHSKINAPLAVVFAAFDACKTPFALHMDADIIIGREDAQHDYLGAILAAMQKRDAITMSLNIPGTKKSPARENNGAPFRLEVRAGVTNLTRLKKLLPLPNHPENGQIALSWHRAADEAIRRRGLVSLRGGDQRLFAIHPPNEFKNRGESWNIIVDRAERGFFPAQQQGYQDWNGSDAEWILPERAERFVVVICGRNVARGRIDRCLDSLLAQRYKDWGAVVIDDASRPALSDYLRLRIAAHAGRFSHLIRWKCAGELANLTFAVHRFCADSESIIVTLDLDDALIGDDVLDYLAHAYNEGADVTVGSMLRTDKYAEYPVSFDNPRNRRGGGNVWQHLRSFKKQLFDSVPNSALRDDDGEYFHPAEDWAYILPIVEAAKNPVWIHRPLYLHEPGVKRDSNYKLARESAIARIIKKFAGKGAKEC